MLRLSPNEAARLLSEEASRRRRERLTQVREKSRVHATKVRNAVKLEKSKQLQALATKIEADWEEEKAMRLMQLLQLQDACLRAVGQGHTAAKNWDPRHEESVQLMLEDNERAERRHQAALERLRLEQAALYQASHRITGQRLMAREKERLRAKHVASLPRRPPDPLLTVLGEANHRADAQPRVCAHGTRDPEAAEASSKSDDSDDDDAGGDIFVERSSPASAGSSAGQDPGSSGGRPTLGRRRRGEDGREGALQEEARATRAQEEAARKESEQREMARLRHKHALRKEVLQKDYQQMLAELDDLQRADRRRRQQVLERIPRSLYLPPHVVLEKEAERQEEMERQFEELYESVAGNVADIRGLATEVDPLGGTPTASEDTESAALEVATAAGLSPEPEPNLPRSCAPLRDITNVAADGPDGATPGNVRGTGTAGVGVQRLKRAALKKLRAKIQDQKSTWLVQTVQGEPPTSNAGDSSGESPASSTSGNSRGGAAVVQPATTSAAALFSPGLSTVSSGNEQSSASGAPTTPTLSQYTIDSDDGPSATSPKRTDEPPSSTAPSEAERRPAQAGQPIPVTSALRQHRRGVSSHAEEDKDKGEKEDGEQAEQQPLEWIERQKHELQEYLHTIAAQRHALENLQSAATERHRRTVPETAAAADEWTAGTTNEDGYARERRIREYQERLLSRGETSRSLSVSSRNDEHPLSQRSASGAVANDRAKPSSLSSATVAMLGGLSNLQRQQPANTVMHRADPGSRDWRDDVLPLLNRGSGSTNCGQQRDTCQASATTRQPVTVAVEHLRSFESEQSPTDDAADASQIPGYVPAVEREALLRTCSPPAVQRSSAAVSNASMPPAVAPPVRGLLPVKPPAPSRQGPSGDLSIGRAPTEASAAAPADRAFDANDRLPYVSIEERERLMSDLDSAPHLLRLPGAATAATSTARHSLPKAKPRSSTIDGSIPGLLLSQADRHQQQSHSSITAAAAPRQSSMSSSRSAIGAALPAMSFDDAAARVTAQLNPSYESYQDLRAAATAPASSSSTTLQHQPADSPHDPAASAIFSAALAQQMLERQQAFNRRQEELRRQLAEIQRQKSEILLRHQPSPLVGDGAKPSLVVADSDVMSTSRGTAGVELGQGNLARYPEESTEPLGEASRHVLSTIQEVDDTSSKLGSYTDNSDDEDIDKTATGPLPPDDSVTEHPAIHMHPPDASYGMVPSPVIVPTALSAPKTPLLSSLSSRQQSSLLDQDHCSETELTSGTLVTSSSSSTGTSSYNPLQLDCSAATTDPSSGSTSDLIIENSLWPSKPYGADQQAYVSLSAASASNTGSGSSPSQPSLGRISPQAASIHRLSDEESPATSSGVSGSFKPLPLDDSSSNTDRHGAGTGYSAAQVLSSSEGSNSDLPAEMTDGGSRVGLGQSADIVSLCSHGQASGSSMLASARTPALDPARVRDRFGLISELEDDYDHDFLASRPPSSTPLKYRPLVPQLSSSSTTDADVVSFPVHDHHSFASEVSLPSGIDIQQEPELTFISLSASSAQCESEGDDPPSMTLTSEHQQLPSTAKLASRSQPSVAKGHQKAVASKPSNSRQPPRSQVEAVITTSDRKKLERERRMHTKLLYERLEEVQAQRKAKEHERMRLEAPVRRAQYDAKLKQRKQASQLSKECPGGAAEPHA